MAKSKLVVPDGKVVAFIEPYEDRNLFGKLNKACVIGKIMEEFKYSHEFGGTRYYRTIIGSKRASGAVDRIPIIITEEQLNTMSENSSVGKDVQIAGRYRSYRMLGEDEKIHLEFALLASEIKPYEGDKGEDTNVICIEGTLCKTPVFRETPNGRGLTNFFVKVPKSYTKSDFIPCIAWEQIGLYVCKLKPGSKVKIFGRIQSRKYEKNSKWFETYEVSIWRLKKLPE